MSAQPTYKPYLYEITEDLIELEKVLDDPDVPQEEKEYYISVWLRTMEDLNVKLDGYCSLMREIGARAEIRKNEAKRLRDLSDADANKVKTLKERLLGFLGIKGMEKWNTTHYRISVCGNGGVVPLVHPEDPTTLPPIYQRIKIEADVEAIRTDLEAGIEIPGCALLERGKHLRVS